MTHKDDPAGEARQHLKDWKPKEPRRPFLPQPGGFGAGASFPVNDIDPDLKRRLLDGNWDEIDEESDGG